MITPDAVREGIERGEFFLEYLPTVALDDGRCVGAEALARWRRPTGLVPPGEFVPVIEDGPIAGLLTFWVMETVKADLGEWLAAHPGCHVGINVPPIILGRGGVLYAAMKSGLHALRQQLVLEVTERGIPDRIGLEALESASQQGIRIALDDVTLAGANLAILSRCRAHIIKLDRSLVSQITAECPRPEWLAGFTELLRATRMDVIAEGVETAGQAAALRAAGINMAQGFHFSRPLAAEAFRAFHAEREPATR
jgi:EAL domain-containing protein (putative c-di-GMP-specific phosphodiesterase class I)